jgi:hypothetical protein
MGWGITLNDLYLSKRDYNKASLEQELEANEKSLQYFKERIIALIATTSTTVKEGPGESEEWSLPEYAVKFINECWDDIQRMSADNLLLKHAIENFGKKSKVKKS